MNKIIEKEYITASGQKITFQTGKIAGRSDGAVVVKTGKCVLLATVNYDKNEGKESDFLPLHVDYQEKYYSVGKIPTNNTKREGKLNEHEILICRLIDRCIRPVIDSNFKKAIDVNVVLLSYDENIAVESIACYAVSTALLLARIPMTTCVSECVMNLCDDKWLVNDNRNYCEESVHMSRIIVGGSNKSTIMLEGTTKEISKEKLIEGINIAMEEIHRQCKFQIEFLKDVYGECSFVENKEEGNNISDPDIENDILGVYKEFLKNKNERDRKLNDIAVNYKEKYDKTLAKVMKECRKNVMQKIIFEDSKRIDGRGLQEIREINCEVGILPSAHGSALFTRGETQALVTVTLGDRRDSQVKECATCSGNNDLFLHYNFPNYSVGEVGSKNSVGRREIGHGNLALNGVKHIIEEENLNNYVIRICSDVLSSNGSSSMATVCGSSLALMDAGVKVTSPIAGIAMGIIFDKKEEKYEILTDISGDEDELGDMDFKVIATPNGINAIQLDVKKLKLNTDILQKGIERACEGISNILKTMSQVIDKSREEVRDFAPTYKTIEISKKLIGQIIGIGGNNIQKIQKESNCFVFIEDKKDSGFVKISAPNKSSLEKCVERINAIIDSNPVVGGVYDGKVVSIFHNAVKVEFMPHKIGLLKVCDIDWCYIRNINEVLHINDLISVKLMEDWGEGKYVLSHKVLIPKPNVEGGNSSQTGEGNGTKYHSGKDDRGENNKKEYNNSYNFKDKKSERNYNNNEGGSNDSIPVDSKLDEVQGYNIDVEDNSKRNTSSDQEMKRGVKIPKDIDELKSMMPDNI